jgi:hypothetical protein
VALPDAQLATMQAAPDELLRRNPGTRHEKPATCTVWVALETGPRTKAACSVSRAQES